MQPSISPPPLRRCAAAGDRFPAPRFTKSNQIQANLTPTAQSLQPTASPNPIISRKGKIARLPNNIRETLNNRLDDGETGATLVEWLNNLPEVQQILAQHFQSRPIAEQNLSEWKQGRFLDWKQGENSGGAAENLLENSGVLKGVLGSQRPSGCLIPELAVTLGLLSGAASRNGLTDAADQKCLFQVADRILRLQYGEQREEKLSLERRHRDAWIHTLPKPFPPLSACLRAL